MYVSLVVETDLFRLHVRDWTELQYFLKHRTLLIKHHFDFPIIVTSRNYSSEVLLKNMFLKYPRPCFECLIVLVA